MSETFPPCPNCNYDFTYQDGALWVCPDCAHEWNLEIDASKLDDQIIKDANGAELIDGDSVSVIKDLKIKGSSNSIKVGTKVKNIRLITDAVDGHNIACKIDGHGAINLKSEFVKKAN